MHVCPFCGYSTEEMSSVVAHMQGSSDDNHRGISYLQAKNLVKESNDESHSAEGYSP
jgi:hypothetical protein